MQQHQHQQQHPGQNYVEYKLGSSTESRHVYFDESVISVDNLKQQIAKFNKIDLRKDDLSFFLHGQADSDPLPDAFCIPKTHFVLVLRNPKNSQRLPTLSFPCSEIDKSNFNNVISLLQTLTSSSATGSTTASASFTGNNSSSGTSSTSPPGLNTPFEQKVQPISVYVPTPTSPTYTPSSPSYTPSSPSYTPFSSSDDAISYPYGPPTRPTSSETPIFRPPPPQSYHGRHHPHQRIQDCSRMICKICKEQVFLKLCFRLPYFFFLLHKTGTPHARLSQTTPNSQSQLYLSQMQSTWSFYLSLSIYCIIYSTAATAATIIIIFFTAKF
jgi:hypothetical protein